MPEIVMNKIHFVVDVSGSMKTMIGDVKEGIQVTLDEVRDCDVSLSTFNNELNICDSVIRSSSFIMPEFECKGSTRLYDCLKEVLTREMKSSNTVIVILTDGLNTSGNSTESEVRELIIQFKKGGNIVKFLGANMDALMNAALLGVDSGDALTYDGVHVRQAFRAVSENISGIQRNGVNIPFLAQHRTASISPRTQSNCSPPLLRRCKSTIS